MRRRSGRPLHDGRGGSRVEAVVPADGVAGIGVRTPIAITFDGPIDPASVTDAIRITPPVPGESSVVDLPDDCDRLATANARSERLAGFVAGRGLPAADSGSVLVFTPASHPRAAHDLHGRARPGRHQGGRPGPVAAGRRWTFTTGGPTPSAQNQIAFLSPRGGVRNVWLMNPDGSNPRQITTELAPVSAFDVSSDGRLIVYATAGVVRVLHLGTDDLATLTDIGLAEYQPILTPDAKTILVGRRDRNGADLGYWLEPIPGAEGAPAERQILPDGAPPLGSSAFGGDGLVDGPGLSAWSPRAAFDPTGATVLLVDALGRVPQVTLPPVPAPATFAYTGLSRPLAGPVWDPAAGFLIVADLGTGAGQSVIAIARPDIAPVPAVGPVAVGTHGGLASLAAPSGDHVGYAAAPGQPLIGLTTSPDRYDRAPGFSPDGTTLLFGRVPAADETRSAGIWLAGLDGRDLRQLSTDGTAARWLP